MATSLYIVAFILAAGLGFGYFSEMSITFSDEGQKVQIVLAALCVMLAVYALFAASLFSAIMILGVEAGGVFTGKVVAETIDRG